MLMFAMDDQAVTLLAELLPPVPHLLDKWAGGVVLIGIDAAGTEPLLDLDSSSKSGHNNTIIRFESLQQILIDGRIVDHLAEQIDVPVRILLYGPVGDVDRVLHPVAEAKVARDEKLQITKIEKRGGEVPFPGVVDLVDLFDSLDDRRVVHFRNIEFLSCHLKTL